MAFAIIVYFIIALFVNVLPYVETPDTTAILSILFLNFDSFTEYHLLKFSPQHIIIFLMFIYLVCIKMLSNINENISFKSMFLLKYTRKSFLRNIIKENIKFFTKIYCISLIMVLVLSAFVNRNFQELDLFTISIFCLYLLRFIYIIFSLNLIYTVLSINGERLNFVPLIMIGFVFLIFIDLYCGCSFITFSNNSSSEFIYAIVEIFIMSGIHLIMQKKFINKEDLFND